MVFAKKVRGMRKRYQKKGNRKGRRVATRRPPRVIPESKLIQTSINAQAGGVIAPIFNQLTNTLQGLDQNQRIGRIITLKSIQINGIVRSTADTGAGYVRCILLQDTQPTGAADPAITAIYDTSVLRFHDGAPRLLDNRSRFKVLKEWRFAIAASTSLDSQSTRIIKFYRKLNIRVEYVGNTGAYGDIRRNSLHFVWGTTDTDFTLNLMARIRFIDV